MSLPTTRLPSAVEPTLSPSPRFLHSDRSCCSVFSLYTVYAWMVLLSLYSGCSPPGLRGRKSRKSWDRGIFCSNSSSRISRHRYF